MVVPTMKSKSLHIGHGQADHGKQKRVFDFVQLYTNTSNASASGGGGILPKNSDQLASPNVKSESANRERSPYKGKKSKRDPVDISVMNIDDPGNSSVAGSVMKTPKVTSTPLPDRKESKSKVKSIMKHASAHAYDTTVDTDLDTSSTKPKKRNKSVSFMLEDQEQVSHKKTKSDESTDNSKTDVSLKVKRKYKKTKKNKLSEKENLLDSNQQNVETPVKDKKKEKNKDKNQQSVETPSKDRKKDKNKKLDEQSEKSSVMDVSDPGGDDSQVENTDQTKRKNRKTKKVKTPKPTEENTSEPVNQEVTEKPKKSKMKKHQDKPQIETEEPVSKSRKTDSQPDVVTDLEKLSIGDNAHTLTNLLDEMTVVDKNKRKKLKHKTKNKKLKGDKSTTDSKSTPETNEEAQEKVKWMRRKWNKEHKGDKESVDNTVVVENVPMSLLLSYKKVLTEHYVKYGLVRSVGIAELYPSKVSAPVFTTTVHFYSDGAATEALSDEWMLEGRPIRVRRALPPTSTTIVVRSYAPLCEAAITSALHAAGPIRDIRHPVKGRNTMSTFFVELDGPASVENALKLTTDLKIAGKKVYVSKFEDRPKKEKQPKPSTEASDADHSDSQDNS